MSASLVGSEMCIRDRWEADGPAPSNVAKSAASRWQCPATCGAVSTMIAPVSYTHLTLPTICSV
eukprot:4079778-Alexandrium_andersonii.AAC.1